MIATLLVPLLGNVVFWDGDNFYKAFAGALVNMSYHLCSCKSFAKIVPIQKNYIAVMGCRYVRASFARLQSTFYHHDWISKVCSIGEFKRTHSNLINFRLYLTRSDIEKRYHLRPLDDPSDRNYHIFIPL